MPIQDFLTLKNIQVERITQVPDGMGGMVETETITTIPRGAMWSPGQFARYVSDKMAKASTHVLVTLPSDYTFNEYDEEVIYNGIHYKINGPSDNVMFMDEITVTGLERLV